MHKATLRIVHGFLGAGKSTYSKWLASQTGETRLNADEYCEEKFSQEQLEKNWDDCFSRAIQDLYIQTEDCLKEGRSVILDFGFWSRESRDYAREIAQKYGAEFQHLYLDTPDDVLVSRLKTRSGVIAESNIQKFNELKMHFVAPMPDETVTRIKPHPIPNLSIG